MYKILTLALLISINAPAMAGISKKENMPVDASYKFLNNLNLQKDNFSDEEGKILKLKNLPAEINMSETTELELDKTRGNNSGKASRFQGIAEIGYSIGTGEYNIDYMKFNAIAGYKINPSFSIGIGSGLRYAMDINDALIPFFIDFRANLTEKRIPVYLAFDAGYALDITSDFKSEGFYFLINPAAGVVFKISDKSAIHLGLGYDFQKFKIGSSEYNVVPGTTINTTGISINAGISF
jgi:hypothetical protein